VNRIIGIVAVLALLAAGWYVGNQLWAQAQPPAAPPPLRTRIGLVNIARVFKNYRKADQFNKQVADHLKNLDTQQLVPIRTAIGKIQADAAKPETTSAQKEQMEREMRKLQLSYREKEEDIRKTIAQESGAMMVQLYREVESAVASFARSHDYELVFFYTDPTDPANPYDPLGLQRKLAIGGALPMYAAAGMDLTNAITDMLNRSVAGSGAGTGTGVQPAGYRPPGQ
jgi:Skp family chaperone for outer membrane proteins